MLRLGQRAAQRHASKASSGGPPAEVSCGSQDPVVPDFLPGREAFPWHARAVLPLRDMNPAGRPPLMTYLLIAINVAVYGYQHSLPGSAGAQLVEQWGLVPYFISHLHWASASTLVTSLFLHASFWHLAFNMWFLHIFGDNVEDVLGRARFALFYVVCGVLAALAHTAVQPQATVPMVGASGAIFGVMAAYLKLYPHVRITAFFLVLIRVPAVFFIVFWFVLSGLDSVRSLTSDQGRVAFFAHVGGFLAGLYLLSPLVRGVERLRPQAPR